LNFLLRQRALPEIHLTDESYKIFFIVLFTLITLITLFTCTDYGITWDEFNRNRYGNAILKFYSSFFNDTSFTELGKSNLYGGFFDSTAALISKISPWGEFETRHCWNLCFGLFSILGCWKLTRHLAGYKAAFWGALFLMIIPGYYGHMFNNPKDIPMATGYIWTLYYVLCCISFFPSIPGKLLLKLAIALGCAMAVRIGAVILYIYFLVAIIIYLAHKVIQKEYFLQNKKHFLLLGISAFFVGILAYMVMLPFWPWAILDPVAHPYQALNEFIHFSWDYHVLFKGEYVLSNNLPWEYLPVYILIKLPEILLISLLCLFLFFLKHPSYLNLNNAFQKSELPPQLSLNILQYFILFSALFFPVIYVIVNQSPLYDEMRHFLFIIPLIACFGGIGFKLFLDRINNTSFFIKFSVASIVIIYAIYHLNIMINLHPYQYVYYNQLTGGLKGATNRYETEYWGSSYKEAVAELVSILRHENMDNFNSKQYKIIVTAHPLCAEYYFPDNFSITDDFNDADFFISTTRFNLHEWRTRFRLGKIIVQITRYDTPLILIRDQRTFVTEKLPTRWE